ncbi:MAG: aminotransferase class I/II-fold pyridoxal phosphate-dependent enzyme [Spirochaetia bacterium]|nr:aminotransferase class I/II-fold pyridoxal phosphate-dependent enzyme [Spirochaetia bacterium]
MIDIAKELNTTLKATVVGSLLSPLGKRIYFPKGIVKQSQDAIAQNCLINATAGVALQDGHYITHPHFNTFSPIVSSDEMVSYAPTAGVLSLRNMWNNHIEEENPPLALTSHSLPVVTSGLTHAISIIGQLFIDEETDIAIIDPSWDNYHLIFKVTHQAKIHNLPLFNDSGLFDITNWEQPCKEMKGEKLVFLFNFPHNPTGYTPSDKEMEEITHLILDLAHKGKKILVIVDDAYFGLFHNETCSQYSLFSSIASLHENILAVKCDAATKESLVWGFRVGFITYGGKNLTKEHYEALIEKTKGAIRGSVSSASMVSQSLLISAMKSSSYSITIKKTKDEMKMRYERIFERIASYSHDPILVPLPANSGYFISFYYKGDAGELRKMLLKDGIGVVSVGEHLIRIAYSAVNIEQIDTLIETLYEGARSLWK